MSDSSDTRFDTSIPVLKDILVPGKPAYARMVHAAAAEPSDGVTVHGVTPAQVRSFELPERPAPFELQQEPEPFEPGSAFHFPRASAGPAPSLDAEVLAERLRGRVASYLTGAGRDLIEARCRDALQDHTTRLVAQITREVALALEPEVTGWVREAVEEEIARRSRGH